MISSTDIRERLKDLWPDLRIIILADSTYLPVNREKLEKIIKTSGVGEIDNIPLLGDCDDRALILHAYVNRTRACAAAFNWLPEHERFPWTFGEVFLAKFQGFPTNHVVNIAICDEDILLVEPQGYKITVADPNNDSPYFVRM